VTDYYVRFDAELLVELQHEGDDAPDQHELEHAVFKALRAGNVPAITVYEAERQR